MPLDLLPVLLNSIRNTRIQPQRITANFRNEKELKLAEHWGITQK